MNTSRGSALPPVSLKWILIAGGAGGLAEVLWVSLYTAITPADGVQIAREITITVFGTAAGGALAPTLGVIVHMVLAVAVAAAFAAALWRPAAVRFGNTGIVAAALAVLSAIWVMNFFVVLPAVNPTFVTLMPLSVTFASKALFGIGMGAVLCTAPQGGRRATDRSAPALA